MSKYHYSGPSIDHSLLSPSGHVSERARKAAMDREAVRLFPPGYWDKPKPTEEQVRAERKESLLRHAAMLRDFAAKGFRTRYHTKHAEAAEAEAAAL